MWQVSVRATNASIPCLKTAIVLKIVVRLSQGTTKAEGDVISTTTPLLARHVSPRSQGASR